MTENKIPSEGSSPPESNKELQNALKQVVESLAAKVQSHPKGTLFLSILSIILNIVLTPTAIKEYLPQSPDQKFFDSSIGSILYCEKLQPLKPPTGIIPLEFSSLPTEAKFLAEGYVGRLGLCISGAQQEQADQSYEVLLTDKVSGGNLLIEMDIIHSENGYKIEEFEKSLTWSFVQNEDALEVLEKKIVEKCKKPQDAKIELSERNPHRIPGAVLQDEKVFYEFECDSKDGGPREYEVNHRGALSEQPLGPT